MNSRNSKEKQNKYSVKEKVYINSDAGQEQAAKLLATKKYTVAEIKELRQNIIKHDPESKLAAVLEKAVAHKSAVA